MPWDPPGNEYLRTTLGLTNISAWEVQRTRVPGDESGEEVVCHLGYRLEDNSGHSLYATTFALSNEGLKQSQYTRVACHLMVEAIKPQYIFEAYKSIIECYLYQQHMSQLPEIGQSAVKHKDSKVVERRKPRPFKVDEA